MPNEMTDEGRSDISLAALNARWCEREKAILRRRRARHLEALIELAVPFGVVGVWVLLAIWFF
jgi:hypothetical protein